MNRVKICGLSRPADIQAVNQARPDYIGFVFAPSRRQIDPAQAQTLKQELDPRILSVGVFVDQPWPWIAELAAEQLIDLIQLHGQEGATYLRQLRAHVNLPIIRSVRVGRALPAPVELRALAGAADYLLLDTATNLPDGTPQPGGSGQSFDWRLLQNYSGPDYFLAGGLNCQNVTAALQQLHPFAVDTSSGVETDGVKDASKIAEFVRLVRAVEDLQSERGAGNGR